MIQDFQPDKQGEIPKRLKKSYIDRRYVELPTLQSRGSWSPRNFRGSLENVYIYVYIVYIYVYL